MVALNPDPARIDGVLLPFFYPTAAEAIELALASAGRKVWRDVTMAQAVLNDGQSLLAVNDLFIGQKTHASARYRIRLRRPGGGPVVERDHRLDGRRLDRLASLDPDRRCGDRSGRVANDRGPRTCAINIASTGKRATWSSTSASRS